MIALRPFSEKVSKLFAKSMAFGIDFGANGPGAHYQKKSLLPGPSPAPVLASAWTSPRLMRALTKPTPIWVWSCPKAGPDASALDRPAHPICDASDPSVSGPSPSSPKTWSLALVVSVCIDVHVCLSARACACMRLRLWMHRCLRLSVCACVPTRAHARGCLRARACAYVHVSAYVSVRLCSCVHALACLCVRACVGPGLTDAK